MHWTSSNLIIFNATECISLMLFMRLIERSFKEKLYQFTTRQNLPLKAFPRVYFHFVFSFRFAKICINLNFLLPFSLYLLLRLLAMKFNTKLMSGLYKKIQRWIFFSLKNPTKISSTNNFQVYLINPQIIHFIFNFFIVSTS